MRLNNKGFAMSGVLYPVLLLFLVLIMTILSLMANRKVIFDKTKLSIIENLDSASARNAPKINILEQEITLVNTSTISNFEYDLMDGVSATSSDGSSIDSSNISYTSDPAFNPRINGTYEIAYTVKDSNNKMASASRVVHVVDPNSDSPDGYKMDYTYDYTGSKEEFVPSVPGLYLFQIWGAQGGNYNSTYKGGKGAYASGRIEISESSVLSSKNNQPWRFWIYVGEAGTSKIETPNATTADVIFNGGGAGSKTCKVSSITGGGATDIRFVLNDFVNSEGTVLENWDNTDSLKARVVVAAGGGGAGYNTQGGAGGTLTSSNGNFLKNFSDSAGLGASQTSGGGSLGKGGNSALDTTTSCSSPYTASTNGAGGGGGYYGGGGTREIVSGAGGSGAGGSSYINGHDGCPLNDNGVVFTNTMLIPGDGKMPVHSGTTSQIGNSGNGYVRITLLKYVNK